MSENKTAVSAILYSAKAPSPEQERRFCDFIASKYGENIPLVWESSDKYKNGFRLEIGSDVYDWSIDGRFEQLKQMILDTAKSKDSIPLIRENLRSWTPKALPQSKAPPLPLWRLPAAVCGLNFMTS